MDEEETKRCPNCKRDIPATNFTIHSVHCARNIKLCPVCKEPVPQAELDDHHKKLHKLLPCKQCGESVCGTDLEDHVRDSCANTVKTCRFCELELPRRELPAHEGYCGVRTEQCPECREWVMLKYRQLHLDSNHGFLRLDDDPAPSKKEPPKLNLSRPTPSKANIRPIASSSGFEPLTSAGARTESHGPTPESNSMARPDSFGPKSIPNSNSAVNLQRTIDVPKIIGPRNTDNGPSNSSGPRNSENGILIPDGSGPPSRPTSIFDDFGPSRLRNDLSRTDAGPLGASGSGPSASPHEGAAVNGRLVGVKKRSNDQPQINTNAAVANKVDKDLPVSRGAVKKRPAPKPPRAVPADPRRDMAFYSALQRQQREERERREQNEYNLAHGLPPVLSPAAKIEKLRKMDALQNRDFAEEPRRRPRSPAARAQDAAAHEFKNLKPMSPEQFMARFNELKVRGDAAPAGAGAETGARAGAVSGAGAGARPPAGLAAGAGAPPGAETRAEYGAWPPAGLAAGAGAAAGGDRFTAIKSSLKELRRGLNEVTAPYNNNNMNANNNDRVRTPSPAEEVRLPCEFCGALVPADDLVLHQTGCRPDLAQYWGEQRPPSPRRAAPAPRAAPRPPAPPAGDPVIPCEFCAQSLPVYLITEHQERCAREVNMLSAD